LKSFFEKLSETLLDFFKVAENSGNIFSRMFEKRSGFFWE